MPLKRMVLRWCGVCVGVGCRIQSGVKFFGNGPIIIGEYVVLRGDVRIEVESMVGKLELGDYVEVNHGSYLAANGKSTIRVGSYTRIAHFCSLKTSTHKIDFTTMCVAGDTVYRDILIGKGSWLCASCVVLPGVRIGERVVVAAGAVVIKDVPENMLVAGVPAVIKKSLN